MDAAGNAYVCGQSYASVGSPDSSDMLTVKYGRDGSERWTARWDGSRGGPDAARGVAVDGAGNVYVCGYTDSAVGGNAGFVTVSTMPRARLSGRGLSMAQVTRPTRPRQSLLTGSPTSASPAPAAAKAAVKTMLRSGTIPTARCSGFGTMTTTMAMMRPQRLPLTGTATSTSRAGAGTTWPRLTS